MMCTLNSRDEEHISKGDKIRREAKKLPKSSDIFYERPRTNNSKLLFDSYQFTGIYVLDESHAVSQFAVK